MARPAAWPSSGAAKKETKANREFNTVRELLWD
jgi:hypothetical protein